MDQGILKELKRINQAIQKLHKNLLFLIYSQESGKYPNEEKLDREQLKKFEKVLNLKPFKHEEGYLG